MILSENDKLFTALVTPQISSALRRERVFFDSQISSNRMQSGKQKIFSRKATLLEPYCCFGHGNTIVPMGSFSYSRNEVPIELRVGRYVSIGPGLRVPGPSHPISFASTSPFSYDRNFSIFVSAMEDYGISNYNFEDNPQKPSPKIENDVWIGQDVSLMPGIVISDGAVIAANSTVTKSVPPYSIVAGSPARVIKLRFSHSIIERMMQLKWWQYHFADFKGMSHSDPDRFCNELDELIASGNLKPWKPSKICFYDLVKNCEYIS